MSAASVAQPLQGQDCRFACLGGCVPPQAAFPFLIAPLLPLTLTATPKRCREEDRARAARWSAAQEAARRQAAQEILNRQDGCESPGFVGMLCHACCMEGRHSLRSHASSASSRPLTITAVTASAHPPLQGLPRLRCVSACPTWQPTRRRPWSRPCLEPATPQMTSMRVRGALPKLRDVLSCMGALLTLWTGPDFELNPACSPASISACQKTSQPHASHHPSLLGYSKAGRVTNRTSEAMIHDRC